MTKPIEGDIWRERDRRKVRLVKILRPVSGWVRLRTCTAAGVLHRGTRVSLVDPDQFLKRFTKVTP